MKEKGYTLKTLLVVNRKTLKTICLSFCNGKKHDFRLFLESGVYAGKDTEIQTDTGIKAIHTNFFLPKKHRKNTNLTKEEKRNNNIISSKRIYAEHTIRFVKHFHILSERYRNRRKNFLSGFLGLLAFVTLICLFNFARGLLVEKEIYI